MQLEYEATIDLDQAREFLRQKRLAREFRLDERFKQANEDACCIVAHIAEKYQPLRIYQWGSVLRRDHFSEISDIDLAVEGIQSAEQFFAMYGDTLELTSFPLDLVELEKIHPLHAADIVKRGRLVYERA